jgi:hypothetical protein
MKFIKTIFILISGLLSALYLANIGAGIVEIIPDNIPLAGNIDEFIASLILLNALAYFGLDLRRKPLVTTGPPAIEP